MVRYGVLLLVLACAPLCAQINLDPPAQREFVRDLAGLLAEADKAEIRRHCERTLNEKAIPIVVVTIKSMADHYGAGMTIETFATTLYNQWGVGHTKLHGQPWNKGILLLVSTGDRKARIELGAGWAAGYDATCQSIVDNQIIPRFKQSDFAGGIKAGVQVLADVARGEELPKPPFPWQAVVLIVGFFALMVWTGISLYRSGRGGWAWVFWGIVFTVLGFMLMALLSGRSRGGGFRGGSFGGGFSRGGGASGGW